MLTESLFGIEARNLGKSARTRARLMDAAVQLFARDGFEAASVNEITRLAQLANGTFYAHFRDKDEIAAVVVFAMTGNVVRQIDAAMVQIDDAVQRVSIGCRSFIALACSQPNWGRALFRAIWTFRDLREEVIDTLRADLQRGVDQGAFTVAIDDLLIDTYAAMMLSALYGRLEGAFDPDAGSRVSELQLRMLGVAPDRARQVAWTPIPALSLELAPLEKG